MAGNSDQMKEQLAIYEDTADPLRRVPPFGGAEAEPQNSENPDLTPEDTDFITDTYRTVMGVYPLKAPWDKPREMWPDQFRENGEKSLTAYDLIYDHFAQKDKPDFPSSITTSIGILRQIAPQLNELGCLQLEQGYGGPKSWREVSPETCDDLDTKIENVLKNPEYSKFYEDNSSFKEGLMLMQNVFINSNNPDVNYEKHSEYMQKCIRANANGEIILYVPLESDFTNFVNDERRPDICEVLVSIGLPLEKNKRDEIVSYSNITWERLKERKKPHQINKNINVLLVNNIMGTGFEALNSTEAEAFTYKYEGSHEHGFYLAENILDKKLECWDVSAELTGFKYGLGNKNSFRKTLTRQDVIHEQSHRFYPEYGLYGEIPADIPVAIISFQMAEEGKLDKQEVVNGLLTASVHEIIETVTDENWFEGHSANIKEGDSFSAGYLLSAVVMINAMTDSGIVKANNFGGIDINSSSENIARLKDNLELVESKINSTDESVREEARNIIKLAVANSESIKLLKLYRNKIGLGTPVNTPLLQEMVK